jgi:Universal stress protein family
MIAAGERAAGRRLIMVGVDDSAEAEAAAQWAVREAELRNDDVLLVNAYQVPLLPLQEKPAAIARGRQERQALIDKVAATLMMPPTMHLERLVEIDSPASTLPRLSEQADCLRCRPTYSCWSSAAHIAAASGPGGSGQWRVLCLIGPAPRLRSFRNSGLVHRQQTR